MTQSCFCFPLVVIFCWPVVASQAVFVIPFLLFRFCWSLLLILFYVKCHYTSFFLTTLLFGYWDCWCFLTGSGFWRFILAFVSINDDQWKHRLGKNAREKNRWACSEEAKSFSWILKSFQYFDCSKNTQYNSSLQLDYRFYCTLLMTWILA